MQEATDDKVALEAFVSALIEHGDHLGMDAHGRVLLQVAVEPWIFEALCLLGTVRDDLELDDAH
jgi:hypothetical protein